MDGVLFVVFVVALGLVVLSQVGVWAVLVQVVQQQGRILVRLDELARHHSAPGTDELPVIASSDTAPGLAVGTQLGEFELPDLDGQLVRSMASSDWRTLLVHWSTTCGFCELIAPDLARLAPELRKRRVQLILASYGEPEANRRQAEEYGLRCPILLQPAAQPLAAFLEQGTPVAYALDETGHVAEPLVVGADAVVELATRLATQPTAGGRHLPRERPLSESRIERGGLKVGSRAPSFSLPDIHGDTVTLESYRGRRVLLVFTDPECGPCDALAPHLPRLDRQRRDGGLSVVVIGRGEVQKNRRKAEQFEFTFPVALQKRWEVSRAYGIFATPVGFLIDESGVITRNVAMGPEAIVALAEEGLAVVGTRKE